MKSKTPRDEWIEDYHEFLHSPEIAPPAYVSDGMMNYVSRELHPSFMVIISKLALVYVPVGSLSLLICAQFGVGRGHVLSDAFMKFGHLPCMAICGALFLGLPMLAALLVLSRTEISSIRRHIYLPIIAIGIISLLIFFCLGADISLLVALSWLAGGLASGILATEAGIGLPRLVTSKWP